jgi:hypothetical protein
VTSSDEPQPPDGPLREDQPDEPAQQSEAEKEVQEENAGTSLDQPST